VHDKDGGGDKKEPNLKIESVSHLTCILLNIHFSKQCETLKSHLPNNNSILKCEFIPFILLCSLLNGSFFLHLLTHVHLQRRYVA
jgi:hypothetical protein